MNNLTFKQLRYFEALARHGHFGRAADACAISQPALSMQIKELEGELGAALFERGARQVRLTGFGEAFALRVRDILRSVDELQDLARVSQDGRIGRLRIGVIPTVAPYLLPAIIGNLTQRLSRPRPSRPRDRDAEADRGTGGGADRRRDRRAAGVGAVVRPRSRCLPRISCWSVRARTRASRCPTARRSSKMRLLLLEEGHCFRDQALSFCNRHSAMPRELLDGSSLSTLVQMVSAGIGVTLIPEMAVAVETRSAQVSRRAVRKSKTVADHRHDLAQDQPARQSAHADFRSGAPLGRRVAQAAEAGGVATQGLKRGFVHEACATSAGAP